VRLLHQDNVINKFIRFRS